MTRWHDGDSCRTLQGRPSKERGKYHARLNADIWHEPFTLVVDDEFEDTMPVWDAECHRVGTGRSGYWRKNGTNMRV